MFSTTIQPNQCLYYNVYILFLIKVMSFYSGSKINDTMMGQQKTALQMKNDNRVKKKIELHLVKNRSPPTQINTGTFMQQ